MKRRTATAARLPHVTGAFLRRLPLPRANSDADKNERGRVLLIGGSREMPGAISLAATAALRAGAGKLQIGTSRSVAPLVAAAVPEAMVLALSETRRGSIAAAAAARALRRYVEEADAVLVGPGIGDGDAAAALAREIVRSIRLATLVLDAEALRLLARAPGALARLSGRAILTPHAGELAAITGDERRTIERRRPSCAADAAERFGAVVALKGSETVIAAPGGRGCSSSRGNPGLGASGSGDVLSGIIAGLAARGAEPFRAAAWGVFLHARAGERLAKKMGPLGYLPREIPAEVPALMNELQRT